jgi:hypothetical protein
MAATAPAPSPLTRGLPINQESTMAAYTQPTTPLPEGARANPRLMAIRNAMQGQLPLYRNPSDLGAQYNDNLAAAQAMTPGGLSPEQSGQYFNEPGANYGNSVEQLMGPAQSPNQGVPSALSPQTGGAGNAGPSTQTAAGGVMRPDGTPDLTSPQTWGGFFQSRQGVPTGARAPVTPPVVVGSRLPTAFGTGPNVGNPGDRR